MMTDFMVVKMIRQGNYLSASLAQALKFFKQLHSRYERVADRQEGVEAGMILCEGNHLVPATFLLPLIFATPSTCALIVSDFFPVTGCWRV